MTMEQTDHNTGNKLPTSESKYNSNSTSWKLVSRAFRTKLNYMRSKKEDVIEVVRVKNNEGA